MNNCPGRGPSPRPPGPRPRPRRARAAAVVTVMAAAALLAAACSGSPSSTGSGGSPDAGGSAASQLVAYTQCMRSHGVPDYPGPTSGGQMPKIVSGQQVGVSDSRLTAAQGACQALWPYQAPTQAQQRQQLSDDVKFAQCMRSHGLPNFPGPTNSGGHVEFVISVSADGFSLHSAQTLVKARECQHVLPAGSRLPSATEAP
jgi:hypothetical protein